MFLFLFLGGPVGPLARAQSHGNYYDSVDTQTPESMRATLHALIDDHRVMPYSSYWSTDTWDILELTDQDPSRSHQIVTLYKNARYNKAGGGNGEYNREHSWPHAYGFGEERRSNAPYTDCHHLFLADIQFNNTRGSRPYSTCGPSCEQYPAQIRAQSRIGGAWYPGSSNWGRGDGRNGIWETWMKRRGDVARALFYMDVRYEGGIHGQTGAREPDLILTDDSALIVPSRYNQRVAYMGYLSTLLQWHAEDPVDAWERRRNDIVQHYQGNRNPFIDHPTWVGCVFAGICESDASPGGGENEPVHRLWINELHYDNDKRDLDEGVEIAGMAGTDLGGWSLASYNGSTGRLIERIPLKGVLEDQTAGYGASWFPMPDLQNGAPDGIALIDAHGHVVEFLSYEGSLVALDGPAAGMPSDNIGVRETRATPVGYSLQRRGQGCLAKDFAWAGPLPHSRGLLNDAQELDTPERP